MKKMRSALFACLFFSCMIGHAQTVEEIIHKHIAAIGGQNLIRSMKSLYVEGTITVMGNTGEITTQILYGKGYKYEASFQGGTVIHAVTEKGGWSVNPMAGMLTPTPMSEAEAKTSRIEYAFGALNSVLIDYPANGSQVVFEGRDSSAGMKLLKLLAKTRDSLTVEFFIDPVTYYTSKVITTQKMGNTQGSAKSSTTYYTDFRKLDNGLIWPFGVEVVSPSYTVSIVGKEVTVDKVIDPAIFELPK